MKDILFTLLIIVRLALTTLGYLLLNHSKEEFEDELKQCDKEIAEIYGERDEFYRNIINKVSDISKMPKPELEIAWIPGQNDNEVLKTLSMHFYRNCINNWYVLPLIQRIYCKKMDQDYVCHAYTDMGNPIGKFMVENFGADEAYNKFRNSYIMKCPETGSPWV